MHACVCVCVCACVHCTYIYVVSPISSLPTSAGVGRTGTLIAVRSLMQMIDDKEKLNVFNFILNMRARRNYLVQSEVSTVLPGFRYLLVSSIVVLFNSSTHSFN